MKRPSNGAIIASSKIQRAREQAHAGLEQIAKVSQPQSAVMDLDAVVEMYSSYLSQSRSGIVGLVQHHCHNYRTVL